MVRGLRSKSLTVTLTDMVYSAKCGLPNTSAKWFTICFEKVKTLNYWIRVYFKTNMDNQNQAFKC